MASLISLFRHFSDHFHFHPTLEQKHVIDMRPCHIEHMLTKVKENTGECSDTWNRHGDRRACDVESIRFNGKRGAGKLTY